jgi:hypothetical protein
LEAVEIYTHVSNKAILDRKPSLDVICLGKKMCKEMRGRKIMEIGGSFRESCAQYCGYT